MMDASLDGVTSALRSECRAHFLKTPSLSLAGEIDVLKTAVGKLDHQLPGPLSAQDEQLVWTAAIACLTAMAISVEARVVPLSHPSVN
ncbi:hypothetical protein HKD24_06290 [Gluconobacter sp. LMG 31484]|uniref:Uncharacterized protein n=1 Tax=Gluconobacter vitians TaxID=2728102 RepID=A0ABR9Y4R0_9PROT|nr:hypothetical protein [Gluconobacter vitians]MBF0858822.1 hypothetical protein [Gluconobacter vitians]